MSNSQMKNCGKLAALLVTCCFIIVDSRPCDALFLGNIIGCNSLACRLSSLESDVSQLKLQVSRIDSNLHGSGSGMFNSNNNFRPNQQNPFNQGSGNQNLVSPGQQLNSNMSQQDMNGNAPQDNQNRVNYANFLSDYSNTNQQQQTRRVPAAYQNNVPNGQFFNI